MTKFQIEVINRAFDNCELCLNDALVDEENRIHFISVARICEANCKCTYTIANQKC